MNLVIQDLVVIAPNRDAAVGAIADLKTVHHVVTAIQVNAPVAVRRIQPVNHGAAFDLGLEHDGTGGRSAGAQMEAPAAGIIGINARHHQDAHPWTGQAVSVGNGSKGLGRGARSGIAAVRGHIQVSRMNAK